MPTQQQTTQRPRPRRSLRWLLLPGLIVLVGVVVVVWASTSVESGLQQAKSGTVVDVTTGKPIADAYIVVRWYHYDVDRFIVGHGGRGGNECVYRAVASTDASGHYVIPSTQDKFEVRREISIQKDKRYFWDLAAYAPGYLFAWPQNMYQTGGKHPATHGLGDTETLDPVQLTQRPPGSGEISLERYECPASDGNALPFLGEVYSEAYTLACEKDGLVWPRHAADLREHLFGVMPPLSSAKSAQLDAIRKHYRFNDPPSKDDDAQICAILKQTNEEQP